MEKAFRPIPLELLARWVFGELDSRNTVLGVPKASFARPDPRFASRLFGRDLAAPLGVAAGPHSQLAQNIVAAWLSGARFVELKTVQVLDELRVSRPCIDSADETFNCEWSQELKLEQSFDEYLKAWVLVHALAAKLSLPSPGTLFAMSVGYELEGIRSERVQEFVASIRNAKDALPAAVDAVARAWPGVRDVEVPSSISDHVTLSTMHGCPPAEIEKIALYLLQELGVHTWVKLNPTLLGPERLRGLLNETLGYGIEVPDAAFGHDPRFEDALPMVKRLAAAARAVGREFGVKLSNTLEVVNHRPVFPAGEKMMYLSGRALHPLTLTLAKLVDDELDGSVPISFCGGADAWSFADLVADGLTPVTVCTDLLKPGGYARLAQYLENLGAAMDAAGASDLDAFVARTSGGTGRRGNLARHAGRVAAERRFARRERPLAFKGERPLGHFDCIAAPCVEACPAHQNIPDYLWLVARGRETEAIEVIRRSNALPGVTGSICDHPCTERCVRNLYDAPLGIREIKRFAFENGVSKPEVAGAPIGVKVAIVGAGPAGLSAALNLARAGIASEIFEAKGRVGGMVGGAVPRYRLSDEKLAVDLDRLRSLGVAVHLNAAVGRDVSLDDLRARFDYVFLGAGAQKGKKLGISGEDAEGVLDALDFLDGLREGVKRDLGRRVLVVGGGNSAMDGARSAKRLVGRDGEVSIVYRRTRAEMPADPEEVRDCDTEGIGLKTLLAPLRVVVENGRAVGLACQPMKLGEPDASGRPRPVPVEGSEVVLPADTIVTAIGQETALELLGGAAVETRRNGTIAAKPATGETSAARLYAGGDVVRGPASIIKAVADGRAAAEAIARLHGIEPVAEPHLPKDLSAAAALAKKARLAAPEPVPELPVAERVGFDEVLRPLSPEAARREASRCLDCDEVCSLCVTVCPNRANLAYEVSPLSIELPSFVVEGGRPVPAGTTALHVAQGIQIVNLGDACNECGNCVPFCPTSGAPWRDKPTFWLDATGFAEAKGDAFRMTRDGDALVLDARIADRAHRLEHHGALAEYRSDSLRVVLEPAGWHVLDVRLEPGAVEGDRLDLAACALLVALLPAESALPPLPAGNAGGRA
ncbi:MAG TPA: putative selenate reductase subunit YgfK [Thermoanaerobaculia bacterium]|nr:putative selenate reductase subunit YgfK [Thermoanaerobaculia bacterium]